MRKLIIILIVASLANSQVYQNYWPGPPSNIWNWNNPTRHHQVNHRPDSSRVLWQSGWFPLRRLDHVNIHSQVHPSQTFVNNHQAEQYMRNNFPQLFVPRHPHEGSHGVIDSSSNRNKNSWDEVNGGHGGGHGHGGHGHGVVDSSNNWDGYQQDPIIEVGDAAGVDNREDRWSDPAIAAFLPEPIVDVVAKCDRTYCYKSCRLMLVGGGRCTKAGCMCHHAAFDQDGRPRRQYYPEDNIWYELSHAEQAEILEAMREGRPREPPVTKPPSGGGNKPPFGKPTNKPPFVPYRNSRLIGFLELPSND